MVRTQRLVLLAITATLVACAQTKAPVAPAAARSTAATGGGPTDPVTSDPAAIDAAFPAAIEEVAIASGESYMVGIVYVAQGAGPHPLVILLHGYPGDERNADLAQSLRRAGWDVLLFHYRGAWGSQGKFSFSNALEDVGSALAEARTASFAKRFRSDPSRVVLVGHSMGGFLAITAAAEDPARALRGLARRREPGAARSRCGQSGSPRRVREGAGRLERPDPRRVGQETGGRVDEERGSLRHHATRRSARNASRAARRRFARRRRRPRPSTTTRSWPPSPPPARSTPAASCSTPTTPSPTSASRWRTRWWNGSEPSAANVRQIHDAALMPRLE